MWRKTLQTLVIATAALMYVSFEYSLISELGWQRGLLGSLFLAAFAAAAVSSLIYHIPDSESDDIFDEEESCLSEQ